MIKTITKMPSNKPNVVRWNQNEKICSITEFSRPEDINISRKIDEKMNTYGPLLKDLKIFYREYKFKIYLCRWLSWLCTRVLCKTFLMF